jgi:hypothetical protein
MAVDDLHPYDFIQLYGYHPDHVKQEPEPECLGDTLGIYFEEYFKTDDKFSVNLVVNPLKQKDQPRYFVRTSAGSITQGRRPKKQTLAQLPIEPTWNIGTE